jgi:hypothetical protein
MVLKTGSHCTPFSAFHQFFPTLSIIWAYSYCQYCRQYAANLRQYAANLSSTLLTFASTLLTFASTLLTFVEEGPLLLSPDSRPATCLPPPCNPGRGEHQYSWMAVTTPRPPLPHLPLLWGRRRASWVSCPTSPPAPPPP